MEFLSDLCGALVAILMLAAVYALFAALIAIGVVIGEAVYDVTKHNLELILP